jgi:hypothetical protein
MNYRGNRDHNCTETHTERIMQAGVSHTTCPAACLSAASIINVQL